MDPIDAEIVATSHLPYEKRHILYLLRPGGGGEDLPPSLFKMGLQLSSRKNLQFKTHCWCLSHLVPEIYMFEKQVFSLHLGAQGQF